MDIQITDDKFIRSFLESCDQKQIRTMVLGALMVGAKPSVIAATFGISRPTPYNVKKRVLTEGIAGLDPKPRSDKGQFRTIKSTHVKKLIRDAKSMKNIGVGVRKWSLKYGCSKSTISNIFKLNKLPSRRLRTTFLLRKFHPTQRVSFATDALRKKKFKNILFTDEVPAYQNKNFNKQNLRFRSENPADVPFLFKTKSGVGCHASVLLGLIFLIFLKLGYYYRF